MTARLYDPEDPSYLGESVVQFAFEVDTDSPGALGDIVNGGWLLAETTESESLR